MLLCAQDHKGFVQLAGYINVPTITPTGLNDSLQQRYQYYTDGANTRPLSRAAALGKYLGQTIRTDTLANVQADTNSGTVRKVFTCAADEEPINGISSKGPGWTGPTMWSRYGITEAVFSWRDATSTPGSYNCARGQLTRIRRTAQTMLVTDCVPRNGPGGWFTFYASVVPSTLGEAFYDYNGAGVGNMFNKFRHAGRTNVLFVDGHAASAPLPRRGRIPTRTRSATCTWSRSKRRHLAACRAARGRAQRGRRDGRGHGFCRAASRR